MELNYKIASAREYGEYVRHLYSSTNQNAFGSIARAITFQITNQCNLCCSYCYEHNKKCGAMNIHTAKKCIDRIFDMYEANDSDFINKDTKAIVLDFIGGEPLLEAKLIEELCDYYFKECYRRNIPFAPFTRISFATNGQL